LSDNKNQPEQVGAFSSLISHHSMTFQEIKQLLVTQFGEDKIGSVETGLQPCIVVPVDDLVEICQFLHENEQLYFDFLACITAIDNGPGLATMEVIYNFTSIPYGQDLMLKIVFPRNTDDSPLPSVPSLSHIWRTADWHEREAFDLVGINFTGHTDLRRILLPEDWEGHPLRKDYSAQDRYHGIYVRYEDGNYAGDRS
jgi:NADH-quinone oxidoreductase subunit C